MRSKNWKVCLLFLRCIRGLYLWITKHIISAILNYLTNCLHGLYVIHFFILICQLTFIEKLVGGSLQGKTQKTFEINSVRSQGVECIGKAWSKCLFIKKTSYQLAYIFNGHLLTKMCFIKGTSKKSYSLSIAKKFLKVKYDM